MLKTKNTCGISKPTYPTLIENSQDVVISNKKMR